MADSCKRATRLAAIILASWALLFGAGCFGGDFEAAERRIARSVQGKQAGYSPDFYLAKFGLDGTWNRVALVYGYGDDFEACGELVELLRRRYPESSYTCLPAN